MAYDRVHSCYMRLYFHKYKLLFLPLFLDINNIIVKMKFSYQWEDQGKWSFWFGHITMSPLCQMLENTCWYTHGRCHQTATAALGLGRTVTEISVSPSLPLHVWMCIIYGIKVAHNKLLQCRLAECCFLNMCHDLQRQDEDTNENPKGECLVENVPGCRKADLFGWFDLHRRSHLQHIRINPPWLFCHIFQLISFMKHTNLMLL